MALAHHSTKLSGASEWPSPVSKAGASASKHEATTSAPRADSPRTYSCLLCQQRKVKCDKKDPCSACSKARVICNFRPPATPRRRKKRSHEEELLERLDRYEQLLKNAGIGMPLTQDENTGNNIDGLVNESNAPNQTSIPIDKQDGVVHDPGRVAQPQFKETGKLITGRGQSRYLEKYVSLLV